MTYTEYINQPDWYITTLEVIRKTDIDYDEKELQQSKLKGGKI